MKGIWRIIVEILATKAQRKDTLTGTSMSFEPLSEKEEFIAERIVGAAYTWHINFNVPVI